MTNPPSFSEQALEAYFDDLLLSVPAPSKGSDIAPFRVVASDAANKRPPLSKSRNSSARMPARSSSGTEASASSYPAVSLRAYAEPIKTLNLRMPLPSLAPAQIAAPPVASPEPELRAPLPVAPLAFAAPEQEPDQSLIGAPAAWLDNGRPIWAQQPFECLLFKVGGLALAAPLAELGSIYPLDPELLTAIFGQAAWFMGLLPVKGYNVRAIDAAQVVMPERYAAAMRSHYRYVITLHGSDWGLAVDSVADSLVLQPEDVRWRGQRSKRPWLAGTLVTQMCALLDVAQLVWMFQNQDGKRIAPQS